MASSSTIQKKVTENHSDFCKKILDWYDRHRRVLPWRALPHQTPDPYHVWLSEIMLQQTTVQSVIPYFEKFLIKWPTIHDLANAEHDDVMHAWAGLGYYARARNLLKCAQVISNDYNGVFPDTQKELLKLPGIGDYTSAAIVSIAFNKPANVVDGNVERVMSRYHAIEMPMPKGKAEIKSLAEQYIYETNGKSADYAQSLMDLGATICTPKNPMCSMCPIGEHCKARAQGNADTYPRKVKKKEKPVRYGYVYYVTGNKGETLLQKRPEKGLLAGLYGLPTTRWAESPEGCDHLEMFNALELVKYDAQVRHVFTHFTLVLDIYTAKINNIEGFNSEDYVWKKHKEIQKLGIPTVFTKVLNLFDE